MDQGSYGSHEIVCFHIKKVFLTGNPLVGYKVLYLQVPSTSQ